MFTCILLQVRVISNNQQIKNTTFHTQYTKTHDKQQVLTKYDACFRFYHR